MADRDLETLLNLGNNMKGGSYNQRLNTRSNNKSNEKYNTQSNRKINSRSNNKYY